MDTANLVLPECTDGRTDGRGRKAASQPASQLCSRLAPMGVIYMPYEAGIENKAG